MIKKIAILGSTGSIGQSTLDVIYKKRKNFKIVLLTANNNYKKLIKQAKTFNAQNVIIRNVKHYSKVKHSLKKNKTKVFTGDISLKKIIISKLDYTMSSIVGIAGLQFTVDAMKLSKVVAIANKETIICGWNILSKLQKKYRTEVLPVDSEHFSIMNLTKNLKDEDIEEIIITASGGPFLKKKLKSLRHIKPKEAIKHPNWRMGKKISIDSATLMNKVFEVIEAQRIFKIDINKFEILIHPSSYIHSIIKFNNGQIKILAHDTDMKIPIFNSIYQDKLKKIKTKNININLLNNLKLMKLNSYKYPSTKILNKINNSNSLFETVLISSNDELVELYINNKIKFLQINKILLKILNNKKFSNLTMKKPKKISDIINLSKEVRLKTRKLCIK